MKRVVGIGGIFIKARDPEGLRKWYKMHLGIDIQEWGGAVFCEGVESNKSIRTTWHIGDGANFAPSASTFMINFRVSDLRGLIALLREEGCAVLGDVEESEFGKFGWVQDPEGNKVELWEAP